MRSLTFTKAITDKMIQEVRSLLLLAVALLFIASTVEANCDAKYTQAPYSGPSPAAGGISFTNTSTGSYTGVSWDFGDGNFSSLLDNEIDHFYEEPGNYNVCLYIWDGNECSEKYCEQVSISFSSGGCGNDDCVYPGDANLDGSANFYDIMMIGLGFGANGQPRPNASTDFFPQPAPDWTQTTPNGINYKHLDCNGDGTISAGDIDVILFNYNPMRSIVTSNETEGPSVYVKFEQDTVYVSNASPQKVTVNADLIIGRPNSRVEDLHGMAVYFRYDRDRVDPANGIEINYNENAFFGGAGEVRSGSLDLSADAQLDFGATRTSGVGADGFGTVARMSMDIIIADIIDGRAEPGESIEFDLPLSGVKLIGEDGKEKKVQLSANSAKIVFIKQDGVTSVTPDLETKINIYPNPTTDQLYIELDRLEGTELELFDIYGQQLAKEALNGSRHQLNLKGYSKGLYLINIHTTEGVVSKRIMVK